MERLYSLDKLPALISVSGFHTSQRFKALRRGCPFYLALHSIDGLDILTGEEYRQKGGGNFARWQQHITDWHRNLYGGIDRAPAIGEGEYLALSATGPEPLIRLGLTPMRCRRSLWRRSRNIAGSPGWSAARRLTSGIYPKASMSMCR